MLGRIIDADMEVMVQPSKDDEKAMHAPPRRNPFTARLIRDARKKKGWVQNELARRIGVREHDIYRWEKGTEPTRAGLLRLVVVLGIPIEKMIRAFDDYDKLRETRNPGGYEGEDSPSSSTGSDAS